MSQKVPHLKLVVNNSLIDEHEELLEYKKALLATKLDIQHNMNILRNSLEPIDEQIKEIDNKLKLRGNNHDKRRTWEITNPWTGRVEGKEPDGDFS